MNNMQPYIHQHMVQNPMYNYQYQPMIMHDQMRHIVPYMNQNMMQSPQLVQNMVQNPQSMAQNVIQNQAPIPNSPNVINSQNVIQSPLRLQMEQKRESPLLSHILHNNMAKQAMATSSQHSEFNSPMQIIRPHFQNARPQMIIVNPIAPTHTCTHHQNQQNQQNHQNLQNHQNHQKEAPGVSFEKPKEVPIQIRKQIPDGLSVKTVFKLSATALVRPNDYVQNIAPVDEAHPRVYPKPVVKPVSNRDAQTNYKRKIREILEQNNKDETEAQIHKRNCLINKQEATNKHNNAVRPVLDMPILNDDETQNISSGSVVAEQPQNEQNAPDRVQLNDKLLRNTVYVQARGIVNEVPNPEIQNASTSAASNQNTSITKVKIGAPIANVTESRDSLPDVSVNISIVENTGENVGDNNIQTNTVMPETVLMNGCSSKTQNDLTITPVMPTDEADTVALLKNLIIIPPDDGQLSCLVKKEQSKSPKLPNAECDDAKLRKILKMARFRYPDDPIKSNKTATQNRSKITTLSSNNESDDAKNRKLPKINQFLHSDDADGTMTRHNSKMTKILQSSNADIKVKTQKTPEVKSNKHRTAQQETEPERARKQRSLAKLAARDDSDIFVLTHVLDGHIIQESNVPFLVS